MRRPPRLVVLLPLLIGLAAAAAEPADPADRTDEAFGRLLAMPGAQPLEGGWIVPHEPARDEGDLIARWQRLKQGGADPNAMRHGGTLLAHALRAGRERAAIWLLRNGADARKVLAGEGATAWDLAARYQRKAVLRVLEQDFGFKPAATVAPAAAPAAASGPAGTRVEQGRALLRQFAGPVLQPGDEQQRQWRRYAAALGDDEFRAVVEGPAELELLVVLTRHPDGALEEALARLPLALVRSHAQGIADLLAPSSDVSYAEREPRIAYTGAARAWPALWKRLDRPLRYERWPDLAGRIPPALWPGLFASGYAPRDADDSGCTLAAVDLPGFKSLWPDFRRLFPDALAEAPGLVLAAYRVSRDRAPCYRGSTPAETAAKLAFLRAQGATQPVHGLLPATPEDPRDPALASMIAAYTPATRPPPRLVAVAPACELVLGEAVLDTLVRTRRVGWGTPAQTVGIVEVPGQRACGLVVGGDGFPDDGGLVTDSFAEGPFRDPPVPRCADAPDDVEIWWSGPAGVRRLELGFDARGLGLAGLHAVRDVQTGRRYWVDAGQDGPMCAQVNLLPRAYDWQVAGGLPKLVPSADDRPLARLLRRQCTLAPDDRNVRCPEMELPAPAEQGPVVDRLRQGATVPLVELVETLGRERRAAYRAALAARDHARLRSLLASGIPPAWTAAEIAALAGSELPLADRRRRIALLFANAGQLQAALEEPGLDLAKALAWLPRADWGPVLRLVRQSPVAWYDRARGLREALPDDVACDLDRAQGFLCGGGLKLD